MLLLLRNLLLDRRLAPGMAARVATRTDNGDPVVSGSRHSTVAGAARTVIADNQRQTMTAHRGPIQ